MQLYFQTRGIEEAKPNRRRFLVWVTYQLNFKIVKESSNMIFTYDFKKYLSWLLGGKTLSIYIYDYHICLGMDPKRFEQGGGGIN